MRYTVWRRSDGYVNGTAYDPSTWRNNGTDRNGNPITFEVLLRTDDWYGEAVLAIEAEREKEPLARAVTGTCREANQRERILRRSGGRTSDLDEPDVR